MLQSGTILGLISRLRRMVKYTINEGVISGDLKLVQCCSLYRRMAGVASVKKKDCRKSHDITILVKTQTVNA
ncbi:MAG: hypothetical protein LBB84_05365 [Tannerellaceae bacterium]|jgi:hypothetical protein|nr:hypothetical protein [Tannerellaceae bacterium]